jgi:hypothetical protein
MPHKAGSALATYGHEYTRIRANINLFGFVFIHVHTWLGFFPEEVGAYG